MFLLNNKQIVILTTAWIETHLKQLAWLLRKICKLSKSIFWPTDRPTNFLQEKISGTRNILVARLRGNDVCIMTNLVSSNRHHQFKNVKRKLMFNIIILVLSCSLTYFLIFNYPSCEGFSLTGKVGEIIGNSQDTNTFEFWKSKRKYIYPKIRKTHRFTKSEKSL